MLQNRTKLVLGLTYFELGDFNQAIDYLKDVPPDDENHPRALLGLGWCYLKLQQYYKMVKPLETFVADYQGSEYLPEVYLLLGQAHLKIRLYDKAISYFSQILNRFPPKAENGALLESISGKIAPIEQQIEQQRLDLLLQESKLLQTLHLPSRKWIPGYMKKEIREIEKRRSTLLNNIDQEKKSLTEMVQTLQSIRILLKIQARDWRSYAEYGISRALFLKEQEK